MGHGVFRPKNPDGSAALEWSANAAGNATNGPNASRQCSSVAVRVQSVWTRPQAVFGMDWADTTLVIGLKYPMTPTKPRQKTDDELISDFIARCGVK